MDTILECATSFKKLLNVEYKFTLSIRRQIREIIIDFEETDFRHMTGLHYVDDITIESNPTKVLAAIANKEITDELLNKSSKYTDDKVEGKSIKSRVEELVFLEDYLDKSDLIRIFEIQPFGSLIKADYFIEATLKNRQTTVYIFLRKREQNGKYVIVSFFKKSKQYVGTSMYFMLKEKIANGKSTEFYRNSGYTG